MKKTVTQTRILWKNQSMQHLDIFISSSLCLCELLLVPQYIGKIGRGIPENKNCTPPVFGLYKDYIGRTRDEENSYTNMNIVGKPVYATLRYFYIIFFMPF